MLTSDKLPAEIPEVHLLHLIGEKIIEITRVLLVIILMDRFGGPASRKKRHLTVLLTVDIRKKSLGCGRIIFVQGWPCLRTNIDQAVGCIADNDQKKRNKDGIQKRHPMHVRVPGAVTQQPDEQKKSPP